MIEFPRYIRLTFAISLFVMAISSVCWLIYPAYQTHIAGFVLGTVFSMLNGLILADKTVKISEFALGKRAKRQGTGSLQRFLLAGFAGYMAIRYPDYFHWLGVAIGLCTVTIISLCVALFDFLRKNRNGKG